MPAIKDVWKLLANVPGGAWVALSADEERVVSYDADLQTAVRKAHESGEANPVVIRAPLDSDAKSLLL